MSWHPLRDSFDLQPETQTIIRNLSERIDDEAREELHKDLCGCPNGDQGCEFGPVNVGDAPSEFVIAWLLRERLITPERLYQEQRRMAADIIAAHNDLYHPGQQCPGEDEDGKCAARTGKPAVLAWTDAGLTRPEENQ